MQNRLHNTEIQMQKKIIANVALVANALGVPINTYHQEQKKTKIFITWNWKKLMTTKRKWLKQVTKKTLKVMMKSMKCFCDSEQESDNNSLLMLFHKLAILEGGPFVE